MKIRHSFVSNSSSSSFVVSLDDITTRQYYDILNHGLSRGCEIEDSWVIRKDDNWLYGSTIIENFSMYEYMVKLNVDMDKVEWSE